MKHLLALCCLLIPAVLHGYEAVLYDHSRIRELSDFRIQGAIDLREEKDATSEATYRTLNHEGGTKVRVLQVLHGAVQEGRHGLWLRVLLAAPLWTDSGEWLEKNRRFMIFLPDETPVFDFED